MDAFLLKEMLCLIDALFGSCVGEGGRSSVPLSVCVVRRLTLVQRNGSKKATNVRELDEINLRLK